MIIGIDNISPGLSTSKQTIGGMRHFMEDLVQGLTQYAPQHKFKLFTPDNKDLVPVPRVENLEIVKCSFVPTNQVGRVFYEQAVLPGLVRRHEVDVWLATANHLPLLLTCPSVLFVQTLQVFSFPEGYPLGQRIYQKLFTPLSVRKSNLTLALSQASKKEMIDKFKVSAEKIMLAYHFVSSYKDSTEENIWRGLKRKIGNKSYVLSVSSFYHYKNFYRLIRAFAKIAKDFPHYLVVAGSETKSVKIDDLKSEAKKLGIADRIIFLGRVPHQEIAALYKNADLMVMPSFSETFGCFVLEGMVLGCPVVTSNISSMAEIGDEAVVKVDPYSVSSIAQGMRKVLSNPALARELKRKGFKRAAYFTQSKQLGVIVSALEKAYKK